MNKTYKITLFYPNPEASEWYSISYEKTTYSVNALNQLVIVKANGKEIITTLHYIIEEE